MIVFAKCSLQKGQHSATEWTISGHKKDYIMNDDRFAFRKDDVTCRTLRKLSHRFVKQFGDGLSELEVNDKML